jgi:SAM-dependent methyltransferase
MALRRVVTPESYVIDLGTGSGVLALLAAKAGARRVSAVDINPECIDYARKAAAMNGLTDRVEWFVGHFSEFHPSEHAEVVVCEMLSPMMLVEQQVPACSHAVRHFLRKGGKMIPQSSTVWLVPVESPAIWKRFELPELRFPRVPQTLGPNDFRDMAAARHLATFDFSASSQIREVDRELHFDILEDGVLHGLVGFFESKLLHGITLYMSDGWRELFLPLDEPMDVVRGQRMKFHIRYEPGQFDSLLLTMG